jgi:hypothetical protein
MRGETIAIQKEKILAKLREAGPAGLAKAKLGIGGSQSPKAQAFKALLNERQIANLGSAVRTRFVLIEHFNPLERACEQIERNASLRRSVRDDVVELLIKKDLEKGCEGETRKKIDEAIDILVKEKRLVRFRRSRTLYLVHAQKLNEIAKPFEPHPSEILEAQSLVSPGERPGLISRQLVLAAYQRLKSRLGYSNVEISELQRELDIPMDDLKSFLMEESRGGYAVLSLGDWSVSSPETRSGAVELFGKPHLLVRFDMK